ncbi:hypothetical protein HDV03_002250 [Kappamyces sp. JEL0829]|nr:hypothetical protein HDV03_002250 [Kappamyces sp. JEL0829]
MSAPFTAPEYTMLALKSFCSVSGFVLNLCAFWIYGRSDALKLMESRINITLVVVRFCMSILLVATDLVSLAKNEFAWSSYQSCQLTGFLYALFESMNILIFWTMALHHYFIVVLRVEPFSLKICLALSFAYSLLIASYPLWPQVSDPYQIQGKWTCFWNLNSTKPNNVFWLIHALFGLTSTPFLLFYVYRKIGQTLLLEKGKQSDLLEKASLTPRLSATARREKAVIRLIQKSNTFAYSYALIFGYVAVNMLLSMISGTPLESWRDYSIQLLVAVFCNVTPVALITLDDRCMLYLTKKCNRVRRCFGVTVPSPVVSAVSISVNGRSQAHLGGNTDGKAVVRLLTPSVPFSEMATVRLEAKTDRTLA